MAGMHDVMNAMKRLIETILGSISGLRCTQPDLMLFLHVGQVWLYWMKMGYTAHYLVTTRIVISDPFEWQNAKPIVSCPSRVSLRLHLVKYWCFNQLHFCECKVVKEGKDLGVHWLTKVELSFLISKAFHLKESYVIKLSIFFLMIKTENVQWRQQINNRVLTEQPRGLSYCQHHQASTSN